MRTAVSAGTTSDRTSRSYSPLRHIVLALDRRLRDSHSVFEYTSHPCCILRIELARLDRDVHMADGTGGCRGDRMIELHLWNEHIPPMPREGASIGWARKMNSGMITSLRKLAEFLAGHAELDEISLLRAKTAFGGPRRSAQSERLMHGYGFEPVPETGTSVTQRGQRAAENLLITLMVLAHNPPSLRTDTFRRDRTSLFMSRRVLEERYLDGKIGAAAGMLSGVDA